MSNYHKKAAEELKQEAKKIRDLKEGIMFPDKEKAHLGVSQDEEVVGDALIEAMSHLTLAQMAIKRAVRFLLKDKS